LAWKAQNSRLQLQEARSLSNKKLKIRPYESRSKSPSMRAKHEICYWFSPIKTAIALLKQRYKLKHLDTGSTLSTACLKPVLICFLFIASFIKNDNID
jgi:hypothetical protein